MNETRKSLLSRKEGKIFFESNKESRGDVRGESARMCVRGRLCVIAIGGTG